jgi:hypothetical protein
MIAALLVPLQLAATLTVTRYESTAETRMSPNAVSVVRSVVTAAGRDVRTDILERTGPRSPGFESEGSYTLLRGKDMKMFSVDTAKHTYYELDLAKMQAQLNNMMKSSGATMKVSRFEFTVEDIGDGEIILGHPTRHWRIRQSMDMRMGVDAETMAVTTENTIDSYYAKDLKLPKEPIGDGDTASLRVFRNLIPESDAGKMRAQLERLPKTLALRSIAKGTSGVATMKTATSSSTNVTKIETLKVPASIFEIPAGYKQVPMPDLAGMMPRDM